MTSEPVFLYRDPHPVHERMARRIDAEFVDCSKGGAVDRFRAARTRSFGDRPVLIEGGVPLVEAGAIRLLRRAGPIIELAADATHIDLARPLSGRPRHERLAHRFGQTQVAATLAVSDVIASLARRFNRPVRMVHPFVLEKMYDRLIDRPPGGDGETILCVGKRVPKNGQDVLEEAMADVDASIRAHFVGAGTEAISDGPDRCGHGFVGQEELVELLDRAELLVFPARVGAYPVTILEALVAATPVITTPYVGNADLVRSIDPEFVVEPQPAAVATAIDRALDQSLIERGQRARAIGRVFTADRQLATFEARFNEIITLLDGVNT
jgi:glycosyltransferase involved in cell wall biosynthesis